MSKDVEPPPQEATFVENVTHARLAAGISQTELAKRLAARGLQFHQQTVARVEAGSRPVRLAEAVAFAEVLGLTLEEAMRPQTPERAARVLASVSTGGVRRWLTLRDLTAQTIDALESGIGLLSESRAVYLAALLNAGAETDTKLARFTEENEALLRVTIQQAAEMLQTLDELTQPARWGVPESEGQD